MPGSEAKYWPYGATRSGAITQTDKLYTGQQQEAGDDAMGLYNYKARFYSTVTGRFVSADPKSIPATRTFLPVCRSRWLSIMDLPAKGSSSRRG